MIIIDRVVFWWLLLGLYNNYWSLLCCSYTTDKISCAKKTELEYSYSSTIFWVLVFVLETFGTRKILVLVRLCTRYSHKKAIEFTSTLSNGKASCRSALKCHQNTSQNQFVQRLLCKYTLSTFFAVEPVPIVIGLTQCHTLPDVRSRGAISQHRQAQHLALLDFQTVAQQFWLPHLLAMNNSKLPGVFADIPSIKNYKKHFSELDKSEVRLPLTDQSPHIKFCFIFNRAVTANITLLESKKTLNAGEIKFYYNNVLKCNLVVRESFL